MEPEGGGVCFADERGAALEDVLTYIAAGIAAAYAAEHYKAVRKANETETRRDMHEAVRREIEAKVKVWKDRQNSYAAHAA